MSFSKAYGGKKSEEPAEAAVAAVAAVAAETQTSQAPTIMEQLLAKLVAQSASQGITTDQLETLLSRVGMTTADAMRASLHPENPDSSGISAYFTEADKHKYGSLDQKPKLSRKTYFCGIDERDERLTPAEIEAYNAIDGYRECRNGRWKAEVRRNGQSQELYVTVPHDTVDERMELPSLLLILHELNGGPSTANIEEILRQLEHYKSLAAQSTGKTPAELEAELLA